MSDLHEIEEAPIPLLSDILVAGNAPEELASGRERYRFYRDRGYTLNNYKQGG